jgi:hypothetical protein
VIHRRKAKEATYCGLGVVGAAGFGAAGFGTIGTIASFAVFFFTGFFGFSVSSTIIFLGGSGGIAACKACT